MSCSGSTWIPADGYAYLSQGCCEEVLKLVSNTHFDYITTLTLTARYLVYMTLVNSKIS